MEMDMGTRLNEVDKVEILTLQDNYIDLVVRDSSDVIQRALPLQGREIRNSVLAEHGFSSLVTVTREGRSRSMIFDFGFSADGAAHNAKTLGADLGGVEVAALSHGHMDHTGGMVELMKRVGRQGLELVVHSQAFRQRRCLKVSDEFKMFFPPLTMETVHAAGLTPVVKETPYPLLGGDLLFLGEIPRETSFEQGMPGVFYEEEGVERWDDIADDTSLAVHVRGRGLVVLAGCCHSGIINTVRYARAVTGVPEIFALMGGFHLSGEDMAPAVEPTVAGLKEIDPRWVIPTHCTGREATLRIEREMPGRFILNMSGTRLTFAA